MKSFEKKDSLLKLRENALKKKFKKKKKIQNINKKEKCQFYQTSGLKKQQKQME